MLSNLDPKQIATDLDGCILLCHEKDSTHCHRRIVAEWLEAALGINVPEMDYAVKANGEDSMSVPGLKAIYDRPGEYGKLGLNLYTGCSHDCRYCYNKRADRQQGPYDEPAKKATLSNIEHDLQILRDRRDRRPIYMSALCDPYDMGRKAGVKPKGLFKYLSEEDQKAIPAGPSYTRQVLERLRFYDQPFTILTKGGMLAAKDFAVLLSHAHMDHCGNIGMLRKDVPIVASPETIVIMKGMQDAGISSLETDTAYFSPRQPSDDLGLYLSSMAGMSYQGRDFCCTEKPSEALTAFISRKPGQDGKRAKKLEPGRCSFYDNAAFPFEISAHPVDHSLFGATAYILRGDTTVAYTGDFRLHGKNGDSTREFVKKAKEASVLITEGTRAGREDSIDGGKTTEQSVCEVCREAVESASGLIVADFFARNFERLDSF